MSNSFDSVAFSQRALPQRILRNSRNHDSLLGGGLNASPTDCAASQLNASKMTVFYSGDSQDTRRLGQVHIAQSMDDYVDEYAVLHEAAITALRTR